MKAPVDASSLEPLITSLLQRAQQHAEQRLAAADAEGAAALDRARQRAAEILAAARARGEADGRAAAEAARASAQRRARSVLLAARRSGEEEVRRAASRAVRSLVDDPDYPAMMEALATRARLALGGDAAITELDQGGIRASRGGRSVTYALEDLAQEILGSAPPDQTGPQP